MYYNLQQNLFILCQRNLFIKIMPPSIAIAYVKLTLPKSNPSTSVFSVFNNVTLCAFKKPTPFLLNEQLSIPYFKLNRLWTDYCGMASFSTDFVISQIDTTDVFSTDRFLFCKVEHPHQFYDPFYVLNLYAPAGSNPDRRDFFDNIH